MEVVLQCQIKSKVRCGCTASKLSQKYLVLLLHQNVVKITEPLVATKKFFRVLRVRKDVS